MAQIIHVTVVHLHFLSCPREDLGGSKACSCHLLCWQRLLLQHALKGLPEALLEEVSLFRNGSMVARVVSSITDLLVSR